MCSHVAGIKGFEFSSGVSAMLRNVLGAMFVMTVSLGLVVGEEYNGAITKVDGDKVSIQKMKGKGKNQEKDGDPITLPATSSVKGNKCKFDFKEKKVEVGDPIECGLTNKR